MMENISLSMRKDSPTNERQNVSFKFTKKTSKTLTGNRLSEPSNKQEKDYVLSVTKNEIKSSITVDSDKPLVIPMIKKNNWRVNESDKNGRNDDETKLKELAIKELLKETSEENEKWEKREFNNFTVSIPLIMQNKIPEGYETDDKMDVSLRPDESDLKDYEKVPVDQYGLAMLRGMGWKEGDPIGANNKKCVEPIQVQLRPKGLGLGADTTATKKSQEKKTKEEKLDLVKGSFVHILQGTHQGHYGQVLGLDEENARAIIKISSVENLVTLPEFYIEVISKKEFDKESRVINRTSYEHYKKEQDVKEKHSHRSSTKDGDSSSKSRSKESSRESEKRNRGEQRRDHDSNSPKQKKVSSRDESSKKRKHSHQKSVEKHFKQDDAIPWVRPQLRVRLVDEKYKKGKYFNQKLVVVDVLSSKSCTCRTEDDKYLEDVLLSKLETVIPRSEPGYVMVVHGKYSGEICTVLKRDKTKCVATVQLLSDRDRALKLEYDDICEYVGDISQFD